MRRSMRLGFRVAAAAALAAPFWPASAQCRLCETPTTSAPALGQADDVRLEVEAGIDFDRIVLLGAGAGSAVLRPDGTSSAQGAVGNLGPRAMVGSAVVEGAPGRVVRVLLPQRISLHAANGAEISLEEVVSDLPAVPRLDGAGRLRFRFGGRLAVRGEAEGEYRGDLPITVEYP